MAITSVLASSVAAGTHACAVGAPAPVRINTGGPAYTDPAGIRWAADTGYVGGRTDVRRRAISATASDPLYQRTRQGMSAYRIRVARAGTYAVRLHLAETVHTSAARRAFSVVAEGQPMVRDLDLVRSVGVRRAYVVSRNVRVTDGVLNLAFSSRIGEAALSGIEVAATTAPATVGSSKNTGLRMSTPTAAVSGTTATLRATITAATTTWFRYLQIAVRDQAGRNLDVAHSPGTTIPAGATKVLSSSKTYAPGSYTAALAYSLDGVRWTQSPSATFTIASSAPTPPPPATAPTSTAGHSLAYFYRPPVGTTLDSLAVTHDRYVLTQGDETTRDALRARGAKGPFLQYLRFEAVMDDTGLGYQWHNQVAWKAGDWQRISTEHPDWFLLDQSGRRMRSGLAGDAEQRFYLMDPMNAGWRQFFAERMAQMQPGWDGVFLDNVELSLAKRQRTGVIPAKYPTDAAYTAAVKSFLGYLRTQYFAPTGRPVEANLIEQRTSDDPVWHDMMTELGGGMREGWVGGWNFDRLPGEWTWTREMAQAERTLATGKRVWLIDFGRKDDVARQRFSYASFLLLANGRATYRYTDAARYNEVWTYPNYAFKLGSPLGPRVQSGTTWRREFTAGTVTVDPVAGTSSIVAR